MAYDTELYMANCIQRAIWATGPPGMADLMRKVAHGFTIAADTGDVNQAYKHLMEIAREAEAAKKAAAA